jgi:hypothetical protein
MIIYTDETQNPRSAFEAVAIRAVYSVGFGSKSVMYQAKDMSGTWRIIYKRHNPQITVKVARPALTEMKTTYSNGRFGLTWMSEEIAVC